MPGSQTYNKDVEKLNREIAVDQASMRTSEMKQRKENEKNMDK